MSHSSPPSLKPPPLVRALNLFFKKWGYLMCDHDVLCLVITLTITVICSAKIPFTPQEDDIRRGWSPEGARSIIEMEQYARYLGPKPVDPIASAVFVEAIDGGSMTRSDYLKQALNLLDEITWNVKWKNESLATMCGALCNINEPLRQYYNGLQVQKVSNDSSESFLRVKLGFPFMQVLGKELDLSPHFFGVQQNSSGADMDFAKVAQLNINAIKPENWTKIDVQGYERRLYQYVHNEFRSNLIQGYCLSYTFATDEVVRTGLTIFPFIGIGFLIMSTFSVITVWWSSSQYNQWSIHRVSLAILGCVCPLLATSTALGMLFICGFRFGTILAVTPFLVLAIGVDDAFLQLQSWSRYYAENPTAPLRERVSNMLVDIGPSITITSLTNFAAFLIGYFTPTPEIQLFCIGNAIAIIFDYIYQITMYASMMSIAGRLEMRSMERQKKVMSWNRRGVARMENLLDEYSQWISSKFTAVILFVMLVIYWCASIHGALNMKVVLSPKSLVLAESKLNNMEDIRNQFILPNYTTVVVLVNNAYGLSNQSRLEMAQNLIETLEGFPECIGPKVSHFWLRDYISFQRTEKDAELEMEEEEQENDPTFSTRNTTIVPVDPFTSQGLAQFLNWPEFKFWSGFLRFDERGRLARFMATVSYHGANLGEFDVRKELLGRWRDVVEQFPELDASVFDDFSAFVDQTETILPATISSSVCTFFCMLVVCFLFVNHIFTVTVAALAIISICIGVFGLLSYWGINMDPISMSCVIMSIGFSVDFPAHISFHYFREGVEHPGLSPSKRIAKSLEAIGFPLLQCGISTILFVLCLLCINTYMGEVFVKTMVLVVSLGLIHGLVIVPAFLCALTNLKKAIFSRNKVTPKQTPSSSSSSIPESPSGEDSRSQCTTARLAIN